jgi:hypothetical protein
MEGEARHGTDGAAEADAEAADRVPSSGEAAAPAEPPAPPASLEERSARERVTAPAAPRPAPTIAGAGLLLRAAAALAVVAFAVAVLVVPGLHGNAPQGLVELGDLASATLGYVLCGLLIGANVWGSVELGHAVRAPRTSRSVAIMASGVVVAFGVWAIFLRLLVPFALVMAIAASAVAMIGAWNALRAPHTRAVGAVLAAFGLAALVRVGAWELAAVAGERASPSLYAFGRGLATAAVVLEGAGQLTGAAWLGTRSRLGGRVLSNLAIGAAFLITWGAANGVHAGAPAWQAALHTALADSAGIPPPFGLAAVATFLTSASILLAAVALVQRGPLAVVACSMALALIARGAFDMPLRALAAGAAGQWIMLTMLDDRAMWTSLVAEREVRVAEEKSLR